MYLGLLTKKIENSGIKKFTTLNPTFVLLSSLYFKIRVILTIWLPELTKTILSVGSLVVSTLEPFLFTMLQNFGKYAPNLPTPLYFVPNNLQIYLGWRLDPPTYVGTNSQILPFLSSGTELLGVGLSVGLSIENFDNF